MLNGEENRKGRFISDVFIESAKHKKIIELYVIIFSWGVVDENAKLVERNFVKKLFIKDEKSKVNYVTDSSVTDYRLKMD